MSDNFIRAAYDKVCQEAESAEDRFVTLYERRPYYGGPEEGGWWGSDIIMVKTARFSSEEVAKRVAAKIKEAAIQLTEDAKKAYAEQCSRECDWCEERGYDADYLPEPDGPSEFFVDVEQVCGWRESRGSRRYE